MHVRKVEDIVCTEIGSESAEVWSGTPDELADDWPTVVSLAERGVIQVAAVGSRVEIRGATRVGLVVLPSGRRLVIRSKIPSLVLLEWLAYLGEFPQLTTWLPSAGVAVGDGWHECLARLFLYALEHVTRCHLRKDYVVVAREASDIRGRIVTTLLGQRFHRLPRVPQIQRFRTLATPFNRVLAAALDRVRQLLAPERTDDWQRWGRLHEHWAAIPRDLDDPLATVQTAQWACPPGYRDALQVARLILSGAVLDPTSNVGGQAFTLPLAGVWERALRRLCDELTPVTGWRRLSKKHRTRLWNDPVGRDDPKRWLTADVLLQRQRQRWVLDAKYKREFGDESRVDRFQMCAYAVAFDADRVSLVYPLGMSEKYEHRRLLSATVGDKHLQIDSLSLPMTLGPDACREALMSSAASAWFESDLMA